MKVIIKICIIVMIIIIGGCSSDDDTNVSVDPLVGTWHIVYDITEDGNGNFFRYDSSECEQKSHYIFNEDMSFQFVTYDEERNNLGCMKINESKTAFWEKVADTSYVTRGSMYDYRDEDQLEKEYTEYPDKYTIHNDTLILFYHKIEGTSNKYYNQFIYKRVEK
ncbi:lipocalin family protein [Aquimarina aquimarini]|uniref:lipocalin family protein n=2 Tax=Aquimarina aquimarini TaxID=1191734 RepID=UPI000D553E13|nr:lipocalin family protein [Aquimarina aquimarini]